jgi:hypothetical protein
VDDGRSQYIDIVEAVLTRLDAERWEVDPGETWCMLRPPEPHTPPQGWKLHVSATLLTAPVVLARAAEVLVREGCAFKFARGASQLGVLLSNVVDRGSGGKFITVYPGGDEQFRVVAGKLDRVTDGLGGPRILSDRQLRPGSSVYYRYGAFSRPSFLDNDGVLVSMLVGPDGEQVRDLRGPVFSAPGWAVSPVPEDDAATASAAPGAVLIGDRFVVRGAIRHSFRGGVFRATDRQTGAAVVLKQARPHVMSSHIGTDARDLLRHEGQVLDALGPTGVVPAVVALVLHQENLFLAQEEVPGVTLRDWVAVRAAEEWHGNGAPWADALDQVGQLVDLVSAVHDQGWVLRDLKPNNVMVTPDGRLRLIDLETAVRSGRRALPVGTAGYLPPELAGAPSSGTVMPSRQADLYGLGATILYLLSGIDPALAADSTPRRPVRERWDLLLSVAGAHMPSVARLSPLVRGLTDDDPNLRWDPARARDFLTDAAAGGGSSTAGNVAAVPVDRLLLDGLRHLLAVATPEGTRLWPTDASAVNTDPCTVQSGAAGVLGLLVRAARVLPNPELRDGVAMAADWIDRRLFDVPRILPGLYQGRSGVAWALHDAARLQHDYAMALRAIAHAKQIPLRWPIPDVFHGAAGSGLAQLHLWTSTGDPELKRRSGQVADGLMRAARRHDGRLTWPMPFESPGAGSTYYGFAHGAAGIGAFLLYSALATGRQDHLDAARDVGATLESVTDLDATAAYWPAEEGEGPVRRRHWCHGSSGVGTFLIRLWLATGEPRFEELAEAAATACYRARWQSLNAACHGLAGDGEFLLDLAEFTGKQRYREWAWEFATILHARHAIRDGLLLPADNSAGGRITADYGNGLTGVIGFLLRLRHGGHRAWMPDQLLHPPTSDHAASSNQQER